MPFVYDVCAFFYRASRADVQGYPFMVELYVGLGVLLNDCQQITPPPKIMAFPLNELARCFSRPLRVGCRGSPSGVTVSREVWSAAVARPLRHTEQTEKR